MKSTELYLSRSPMSKGQKSHQKKGSDYILSIYIYNNDIFHLKFIKTNKKPSN